LPLGLLLLFVPSLSSEPVGIGERVEVPSTWLTSLPKTGNSGGFGRASRGCQSPNADVVEVRPVCACTVFVVQSRTNRACTDCVRALDLLSSWGAPVPRRAGRAVGEIAVRRALDRGQSGQNGNGLVVLDACGTGSLVRKLDGARGKFRRWQPPLTAARHAGERQ